MFDYVIIGAGSAGCVLAARLSETPHIKVLLLEAGGPDKQKEFHIPAAWPKLFHSPVDWYYQTEPQSELAQRRLYWPRGRALGGSSSLNAMIYTRGERGDYDRWRDAGNTGWGWDDVLPYFKKLETYERGASEYHNVDGPLSVGDLRTVNPLSQAFVEACGQNGIRHNNDFNGAAVDGAGLFNVTQKNGSRCSTAGAYLHPAKQRPNLTIVTGAFSSRIIFEGVRAVGVEYQHQGTLKKARAEREVILCGGAINSPQLLMLSGIGPAGHLQDHDIPVVADLPGVGENLQDHLMCGSMYKCAQPITMASAESIGNIAKYLLFKKGPLSSNIAEAGAFVKTRPDAFEYDIELIFGPTFYMSHGFANPPGHGFAVGAILQHPESRGTIRLQSREPDVAPLIEPRYLSSETDVEVLLDGLRITRRVAQARAFDAFRGEEVWPEPSVKNDDDLRDFMRRTSETLYHPIGTCRMGNDSLAVVDEKLRVRGIEGLRVVDASVMPRHITGHPNAAVIMIGEKAADLIRGT